MITELGHFALCLALAAAVVQAIVPLWGAVTRRAAAMRVADSAAQVQFLGVAASFAALTWAFVVSDFSLRLVALNSHSAKPMLYKVTGVWMPLVRRDIVNMAKFLQRDVAEFLPDASPDEIMAAGGGLLPASASGDSSQNTVALETAVVEDPKDYKGWIGLAERHAGAGDVDSAAAALASAREQFRGAPFVLEKIAEAERRLGLDLVSASGRGPTGDDIKAASEMTQAERDDMIAGMVAGLAARLEEQPDDPDGWMMLIRSYSTLGEVDKARGAVAMAREHFEEDQAFLSAITREFGELQ